ncbi:MAG: aminoacyl-tRNA hydrolase [Myxococcales bacterium]|nr:aminoacyl-tRNA hydrolase [Myxococcales bacterium]
MFFVIVGLGNPGRGYRSHRHNAGFMVVDRLAESGGLSFAESAFAGWVAEGRIAGRRVLLLKPATFMNKSGECVAAAMRYYRRTSEDLLVVHDDLDLELGRIQVRRAGGSGGHRGVQSVMDSLGEGGFFRLRLGVGRPPAERDAADWVLEGFSASEVAAARSMIERGAQAVEVLLREGLTAAMNRFNPWPAESQDPAPGEGVE